MPIKEAAFKAKESVKSEWPNFCIDSDQSKQESKIKIPDNPYRVKNTDEKPSFDEDTTLNRRGRRTGRRGTRYRNFRTLEENEHITNQVSVPNPTTEEVKIIPAQHIINQYEKIEKNEKIEINEKNKIETNEKNKIETWPNFVNEQTEALVPEEFNLKTYKSQKCPIGEKCKGCNRYHYEGERRRDLEKIQYAPMLCPRTGNCYQQDRCGKCHNFMEIYYHPQIYRSHPCPYTIKMKQCGLGKYCNFIHLIEERNIETKLKIKCKICSVDEVSMARVKCGHTCCKKCSIGVECRKCKVPGDVIKIEL